MHLHYSPFQFATGVDVSTCDVDGRKIAKTIKMLTKKDTSKKQNMMCTMTCAEADAIPGTPTAFISPNPVGSMKDIKMPMAALGVCPKPSSAPAYDQSYRNRMREGYGDRGFDNMLVKAGAAMA
jgi:hypothetical protein